MRGQLRACKADQFEGGLFQPHRAEGSAALSHISTRKYSSDVALLIVVELVGVGAGDPKTKNRLDRGCPGLNTGTRAISSGACQVEGTRLSQTFNSLLPLGFWQFACDSRECSRIWRTLHRQRRRSRIATHLKPRWSGAVTL